jgi:hypothetical protein
MLMGILRGVGRPSDIRRIYKRTRDDVLWDKCELPWRRVSTFTLQISLEKLPGKVLRQKLRPIPWEPPQLIVLLSYVR